MQNPIKYLPAQLILQSGEVFSGLAPASQQTALGEIVFSTGMVGYLESMTDPSYAGQILVFTYPLIGNYGVSDQDTWESKKPYIKGVIFSELAFHHSSHTAKESLLNWLTQHNIPFLTAVDTRSITLCLRNNGVTPGAIVPQNVEPPQFEDFSTIHWVKEVSGSETQELGAGDKKIIVIDCGIKENIIRNLLKFPVRLKRVPYDYDFTNEDYDGVFISNGPGDPKHCLETIKILQKVIQQQKPIFGICLGTQLLALAVGAQTYKLPFGHRSHNQPCIYVETQRCYLTSQNHSYAVDENTLPADWKVIFRNLNDQSVEGIAHKTLPFFAVQFHPESAPGPLDTEWLFERFYNSLDCHAHTKRELAMTTDATASSLRVREAFGRSNPGDITTSTADPSLDCHAHKKRELAMTATKVLILGSGGLRIGQAGEFDYSGSQAIKALKQDGIKTILVNPNIATVQTDAEMADEVYLQPLTLPIVTDIIKKEKPDAIMLGFGGQTALNLGLLLEETGVLAEHNIKVLGTPIDAIRQTEDRDIFKNELESIGVKSPKSVCVTTVQAAIEAAQEIGYPVMLRSGFSLGGLGSGKIKDEEELAIRAQECFSSSPQILIEEYLFGWKEFEYEIIRDQVGNVLTICNMENLDPMGVHTGESIVVAPAQTLTNSEHQFLRNIALKVATHFGIVGECNIQYAVNPANGDYRVIEVNARLSRSSALASKATGYPLAFVAAKLTLGWLLHEIPNGVTQKTSAFFEPALDYLVVKIPRWDTQKFKSADRHIGTEMKSVGEVMGIGRSFPEALQKAIGMLNIGATCLHDYPNEIPNPQFEMEHPTDRRIFALYQYFTKGGTIEEAHQLSQIDTWFLYHIKRIAEVEHEIKNNVSSTELIRLAKQFGFSDKVLGKFFDKSEADVRKERIALGIKPVVKQIDTLAGEFAAQTNYLYLTYHGVQHDIDIFAEQPIIVLGSGPYAIGSSVEFDWCAVNTAKTLRRFNKKAVIINSNPETVSTDYDVSDRLYFEQLTFERVQDIADFENPFGIVVSVGGQIANNLALPLSKANYPILGTKASDIDRAEDREKFSALLHDLHIDQPAWQRVTSLESSRKFAQEIGYPVLVRPSYILSGAAMNVAYDDVSLQNYLLQAAEVSSEHPVVISKFITDAKELEIDGVAKDGRIVIEAINEHIENAGVHSGDATLVLPPQNLYLETIRRTKKITRQIVRALNITGPFNIQFIAKKNNIQVIECNLRASRSFPFVSKVTNHNFIEIATQVILDLPTLSHYQTLELDYVGVKAPQFSYQRLKGANPVAHVEMASTGEVACLGENLHDAFWRAWLSSEQSISGKNILVSIADAYKAKLLPVLKHLDDNGWRIYSTEGTHSFLFKNGIASYFVYKSSVKNEPNVQTILTQRKVNIIINIPNNNQSNKETDGFRIRRLAIDHHIPLITNAQKAHILLECLVNLTANELPVYSWREFAAPSSQHVSSWNPENSSGMPV